MFLFQRNWSNDLPFKSVDWFLRDENGGLELAFSLVIKYIVC